MLASALKKNSEFRWQLHNVVSNLMAKFKVRLPKTRGNYYYGKDGKGTDYFPLLNADDTNNAFNCMESLRLLFENRIIGNLTRKTKGADPEEGQPHNGCRIGSEYNLTLYNFQAANISGVFCPLPATLSAAPFQPKCRTPRQLLSR